MARGIQLQRQQIAQANYWALKVWRLRVDAVATSGGMDPNIFVWLRGALNTTLGETVDKFFTVATVADMSSFEIDNPAPDQEPPFYRNSFVELDFRNQADYDAAWEVIKRVAGELVAALDKAEDLEIAESPWIGYPP